MHVTSVNTGRPRFVEWRVAGGKTETAIRKRPRDGVVAVTLDGLIGDESVDKVHHHDEWMRVYAYASEDYRWWEQELGIELPPGSFGENLTTDGIDVNEALVGEVWRVGTALLQIAHVRTPCQTLQGYLAELGGPSTGVVKRFTRARRPGPYFRVLEPGRVSAGDSISVEERPEHDVTVKVLFDALMTDRSLLGRVAGVPGLKPFIYEEAMRVASADQPFLTDQ